MKTVIKILLGIAFVLVSWTAARADDLGDLENAFIPQKVIILGSFKKYPQALKAAKEISSKTAVPFSTRGMFFDKKKGLIWPEDLEDEIWAGAYAVRRYNTMECDDGEKPCITIERSRFYQGMEPGYYIVVGGIYATENKEAEEALRSFQKVVPTAYAKVSKVYMGCMH